MKKSINTARFFQFLVFPLAKDAENMSACFRENLRFLIFFWWNRKSKIKVSFVKKYSSKETESSIWQKKVDSLKRVAARGWNYKEKKKVVTHDSKGLLIPLPGILFVEVIFK